ncbi:hypothetical protein BH18GEM1_BH18GEM1_22030 [soil metagenome]
MHHSSTPLCLLTIVSSLALFLGCQKQPPPEEAATMEEPVVDVATEVEAIHQVADRYEQAFAAKDVEALLGFYTDDAIWIAHDGTTTSGTDAFRQEYTEMTSQPGTTAMEIVPERTVVASAGDVGYTIGTYTLTTTAADGTPIQEGYRYVVGLEKVGGEWKVDFTMDSAPLAAEPPVSASAGGEAPASP